MTDTELIDWLEQKWGGALVNDDNGHWAFASDGFQNVHEGDNPEDLYTSFVIEKHAFFPTIREALLHAISIEKQQAEVPDNWWESHHPDCGTKYRGCHPDTCPKDQYEKTGVWRSLEQLE